MERRVCTTRDVMPIALAVTLMVILVGQLVSVTVMTADQANAGPSIVILKLMDDENVNWAVDDIVHRLEAFICDDPWIKDRIRVVETDDPSIALNLNGDIIIYVSHGGRMSLVTGDHLTSWKEMARIVEASPAMLHQFAVCFSSTIIQYGSEDASQYVYGVPGQRPAEFIDIDIASNVMLALGMDSNMVEESRKRDILSMKQGLSWGTASHILSFNYVTFDAYAEANAEFEDIAQGVDYVYYWNQSTVTSFSLVPNAIEDYVTFYWANSYDNFGYYHTRELYDPYFTYNRTWVDEYVWGIWNTTFVNGIYNGSIQIEQYGQVNINGGGPVQNDVEWMNLGRQGVGQFSVSLQKTNGAWKEGTVERHMSETGNVYGDNCVTPLLEYDSTWPVFSIPGFTDYAASGVLVSEGASYTVNSIAAGSAWHGPSFVRPLPFAFRMADFSCFRADLGLLPTTDPALLTSTVVALYDENMQLALSLKVYDHWGDIVCTQYCVAYHQPGSNPWQLASPSTFYAGRNGTLQIFLDGDNGLRVDMPDGDPSLILFKNLINMDRVIKYIAVQSYAYSTYGQSHSIIANISVSCIGSEYDIFYYDCQSTSGWISEPSSTDFEEPRQINTGVLHAANGYLYADSIPSGAPWKWGPLFVRELPQEVPIAGIRMFESVIELTYQSGYMGDLLVCLFDDNKEQVISFSAYDSQAGSESRRYLGFWKGVYEGDGGDEWLESIVYSSWKATFKFWYDMTTGSVMSSVDDGTPVTHTHMTDGGFDPSRPVKYIGIQFARAITYPYHDYRLKLHSVKLEASPTRNIWFDNCDSTEGWIRQPATAGFESPYQLNDSGTLYSSGGSLYADGIASGASWKWGPLFVKEIPGFTRVRDIYSLTAQIQFSYVYGRMGDLAVALFDENKELVTTLTAYDSWYGSTTYRYLSYYKANAEGGASDSWLEATPSGSWTAKYQFYCDSTTKAATSRLDDGTPLTHTHFTAQNYDEDRVVRYIGIQFSRALTYTYNGAYLKLDFLKLVYNKHCQEFDDPCNAVTEWTEDLAWPATVWQTASGSLSSVSGYLQVSGLSVLNKGPFWYKELTQPFSVNQFNELAVQLQNAGPTSSYGSFALCLYDEDKVMAARMYFADVGPSAAGVFRITWYREDGGYYELYKALDVTQQTWDYTLRLYSTPDNTVVADMPGAYSVTVLNVDQWAMESSRIIRYIGIQWAYQGTPVDSIRLKDVLLRSGYTLVSQDGSSATSTHNFQAQVHFEDVPPPPVQAEWVLLYGFWPVCYLTINYVSEGVVSVLIQFTLDFLSAALTDLVIQPLFYLEQSEVAQGIVLAQSLESDTSDLQELMNWQIAVGIVDAVASFACMVGSLCWGVLAIVAMGISYGLFAFWLMERAHELLSNEPRGGVAAYAFFYYVASKFIPLWFITMFFFSLLIIGEILDLIPSTPITNGRDPGAMKIMYYIMKIVILAIVLGLIALYARLWHY